MEQFKNIINPNISIDSNISIFDDYFNTLYRSNLHNLVNFFVNYYGEDYKNIIYDRLNTINIHITMPLTSIEEYIDNQDIIIRFNRTEKFLKSLGENTNCYYLNIPEYKAFFHNNNHGIADYILNSDYLLNPVYYSMDISKKERYAKEYILIKNNDLIKHFSSCQLFNMIKSKCRDLSDSIIDDNTIGLEYLMDYMYENNKSGIVVGNIGDKRNNVFVRENNGKNNYNYTNRNSNKVDVNYDFFSLTPNTFIHELNHAISYGEDKRSGIALYTPYKYFNELITQVITNDMLKDITELDITKTINNEAYFNSSYNTNLYLVDRFYRLFKKDILSLYLKGNRELVDKIGEHNFVVLNGYIGGNRYNNNYDESLYKDINDIIDDIKVKTIIKR